MPSLLPNEFSVRVINKKILEITYVSQHFLAESFMRVQEHYENPDLQGQVFTAGQLIDWHKKKYGEWDYPKRWSGFNVPVDCFKLFFKGMFDPLYASEASLLQAVKSKKGIKYVIGLCSKDKEFHQTRRHELAHAMFATNAKYRKKVEYIIKSYDNADLEAFILNLGYSELVLIDEINSYIVADSEYLDDQRVGYNSLMKKDLQDLFDSLKIEE